MTIIENEIKEMTMRDFLTYVAELENVRADIKEKATKEIAKLDKKNAERVGKMSKADKEKAIANDNVKSAIMGLYAENDKLVLVASEIASRTEISTQKASALCRQLVTDNKLAVKDVKVKGKGTMKAYYLA